MSGPQRLILDRNFRVAYFLYRTPEEEANIQSGPQLLVERMLQTGDLERCAVKRIWTEFLGRPMSAA